MNAHLQLAEACPVWGWWSVITMPPPSSFVVIWPYGFSSFLYLLLQKCFSLHCELDLEHRCCPTLAAICTQNPSVALISWLRWSSGHTRLLCRVAAGYCHRPPMVLHGLPRILCQLSRKDEPHSATKSPYCAFQPTRWLCFMLVRVLQESASRTRTDHAVFLLSWVPGSLKVSDMTISEEKQISQRGFFESTAL